MGGKKKFNNNKFNKPEEVKEQTVVQEEKLETTENPSVNAQEAAVEIKQEKETKKARGKGRRKLKEADVQPEVTAQTVINENSEIVPVISENAAVQETENTVPQQENAEAKPTETEEKPVRKSRRPNRNSQKRTRKTTKKDEE